MSKVLPEWGKKCERIHPRCQQAWEEKLSTFIHNYVYIGSKNNNSKENNPKKPLIYNIVLQ
ncbi:MAG: hypothetical protein EBU30_00945 [Synechococcaceae bacterium WB6_3B_236]|jgi:hypothetical protein|nr:hypothetical protein [Synechococcaceae bacterium WB6_3B_236]